MINDEQDFCQHVSPGTAAAIPACGDMSGAMTVLGMGVTLSVQGKREEAIALFTKAMRLAHGAYGTDHPIVACCLCLLGKTLSDLGYLEDAEPMLREALRVREVSLPAGDPDIAVTLHNLAACLRERGAYDESISLLRRARDIDSQAFGPDHDSTLFTRLSLVNSLGCAERFKEAKQELDAISSVLARFFRKTGRQHPLQPQRDVMRQELRDARAP